MPPQLSRCLFPDPSRRLRTGSSDPLFESRKFGPELLGRCLAFDAESLPVSRCTAVVRETEKVECLRFLYTGFGASCRLFPELKQFGFGRFDFQTEFSESFDHLRLKPLSVLLRLEARDIIVRKADQSRGSLTAFAEYSLEPQIQNIVQV